MFSEKFQQKGVEVSVGLIVDRDLTEYCYFMDDGQSETDGICGWI